MYGHAAESVIDDSEVLAERRKGREAGRKSEKSLRSTASVRRFGSL